MILRCRIRRSHSFESVRDGSAVCCQRWQESAGCGPCCWADSADALEDGPVLDAAGLGAGAAAEKPKPGLLSPRRSSDPAGRPVDERRVARRGNPIGPIVGRRRAQLQCGKFDGRRRPFRERRGLSLQRLCRPEEASGQWLAATGEGRPPCISFWHVFLVGMSF